MPVTWPSPAVVAVATPLVLFLALWALCHSPLARLISVVEVGAIRGSAWLLRGRLGRWAGGHPGPAGRYAPLASLVLLGGLAALAAGSLFVELAEAIRLTTSAVSRLDLAVHQWVGHARRPAFTILLGAATEVGGAGGQVALVAVACGLLLARRQRGFAVFLLVTAGAGALLNLGLKLIFTRARPDLAVAVAEAVGYSFPSGHAMGSFVTFGALAHVALRQRWSWAARSAALALAVTLVILVGLSRVYLGVHWVSDVAGGWSAGTVWLASAAVTFELWLRLQAGPGVR